MDTIRSPVGKLRWFISAVCATRDRQTLISPDKILLGIICISIDTWISRNKTINGFPPLINSWGQPQYIELIQDAISKQNQLIHTLPDGPKGRWPIIIPSLQTKNTTVYLQQHCIIQPLELTHSVGSQNGVEKNEKNILDRVRSNHILSSLSTCQGSSRSSPVRPWKGWEIQHTRIHPDLSVLAHVIENFHQEADIDPFPIVQKQKTLKWNERVA